MDEWGDLGLLFDGITNTACGMRGRSANRETMHGNYMQYLVRYVQLDHATTE
jgi:hypothetical protein